MDDVLTPTIIAMIQFINARLDETEETARRTGEPPWDVIEWPRGATVVVSAAAIREEKWKFGRMGHVATVEHLQNAEHMARHSPARVLAEVAATRKIVANCSTALDQAWQVGEEARAAVAHLAVRTLQHLVQLDATHPDYDPGWVL